MTRLRCPVCGEVAGVPILWGVPTDEVQAKVDSGEWDIAYGGCTVPDPFVNAECRACGARWLEKDDGEGNGGNGAGSEPGHDLRRETGGNSGLGGNEKGRPRNPQNRP